METKVDKKELWLRLKAYHFKGLVPEHLWEHILEKFGSTNAATRAFAEKLARKYNWRTGFAIRAIEEYKKFIYLGITAEFPVTPSRIIDQVWHEHILFTRAYRQFCDEVIEYQFEHNPELIPMEDETGKFTTQYLDTLLLYKKEFNRDAPADIWGSPKFRRTSTHIDPDTGMVISNGNMYTGTHASLISDIALPLFVLFEVVADSEIIYGNMPEFGNYGSQGPDDTVSDSTSSAGFFGGIFDTGSYDNSDNSDSSDSDSSSCSSSSCSSSCSSCSSCGS